MGDHPLGYPGPDHAVSADPDQLADNLAAVRSAEASLGDGVKRPSAAELEDVEFAHRLGDVEPLTRERVEALLRGPLVRAFGIVIYHPPTADWGFIGECARAVFDASAEEVPPAFP